MMNIVIVKNDHKYINTRMEWGSLAKGQNAKGRTLHTLEELLDLREKISDLICWVKQEMGHSLSKAFAGKTWSLSEKQGFRASCSL